MMLHALLSDLLELEHIEVTVSRDPRLPELNLPVNIVIPEKDEDVWSFWHQQIEMSDAFWPIAPETGGALEKLSRMAHEKKLLGCHPDAVRLTASKHETAKLLSDHSIGSVPTWRLGDFPGGSGPFVAKPDDGAGSEDTRLFEAAGEAVSWLKGKESTHVIQPWLAGVPASISMLCGFGEAQVLTSNRQLIEISENEIFYRGSLVNGMLEHRNTMEKVAHQVAQALPGLRGYVGIDVMVADGAVTVLEINPRLTTSSVAIHQATGRNLAGMVIDLLYNRTMVDPDTLQSNIIQVNAHG